jgi:tetratricopeptide (TPR) repeat protein
MKAAVPLALVLAATTLGVPARWLHNPRERTARAIEEWKRKDFTAADHHLEEALEAGDENARALYNAGTGKLGAGTPGAALPLLSRAGEAAAREPDAQGLRPDALYNLGNAYMAAGDLANAVESYRSALRLRPGHAAAKHNLELALRQQQQQQQQQQQPQQGKNQQQQQQQQKPGEGDDKGNQGEQPQQPQGGDPKGEQQPQGGNQQQKPQQRSSRLPQFDPQKDMSAEQAAALLEAVENLEREQRRAQAAQERLQRAKKATEKDW